VPGSLVAMNILPVRIELVDPGQFHPLRSLDRQRRLERRFVVEFLETVGDPAERLGDALRSSETRLILDALQRGQGSRKRAAEILGISPRTLRYKLAQLRAAGVQTVGA